MTNTDARPCRRTALRRATERRLVAAALLGVLLVGACGGGGGGKDEAKEEVNSAAETIPKPVNNGTAAPSRTTAPAGQTVELGMRAWYGGFALVLQEATLKTNGTGLSAGSVRITLSLENLGSEPASIGSQNVALTSAGASTLSGLTDLPQVPGMSKANGALTYLVDEKFDIRAATLTFGPADSNQTIIPLSKGGQIVTFEPKVFAVTATASTPQLRLDLKGGRLDASYVRGEKGKYSLRLDVDETNTGTGAGGYFLAATQFSLVMPDGTSAVANPNAAGALVAEAVPAQGTVSGKPVVFRVQAPGTGSYTLNYKSDAGDAAQLSFKIA